MSGSRPHHRNPIRVARQHDRRGRRCSFEGARREPGEQQPIAGGINLVGIRRVLELEDITAALRRDNAQTTLKSAQPEGHTAQ
ncbi:hypothetical protein [Rhodococcus sp. EPR-134]|uniref:hypothetical protein n=1 Tax=Rhodococcus sp. EPR-134 TaxID=1813675 RepID=UPI000A981C07|nr:hypothetical protein [Rhodococcus sp. EPR-134]